MATTGKKGASHSALGGEGPDSTPQLLWVTPSPPSLPSHLGLLGQKSIGGGLLLGLPWGGGIPRSLHLQPCSRSHGPVSSRCNGRRGGRLKKKLPCPFPGHAWPLLGHRERALRWVSSAAVQAESRDATAGQAELAIPGVEAGGGWAEGLQWDSPGGDSPLGLACSCHQGRAVGEEQVPQSSPQSHRVAALLPIKEKSLRQQILLSVKMPLKRAGSCVQTRPEQQGSRKFCP